MYIKQYHHCSSDVLAVERLNAVKMTGPGATPQEYRYRVRLSPKKGTHRLNKRPFTYKDRELDIFRVELMSPGGFRYELCLRAVWHDKADSSECRRSATDPFTIEFPIEDIDEAIQLAAGIDE